MQTSSLKAFVAIAENGSVHGAARQLGLTQTAVTQRLKGLEAELSLTLFLRSRRGMAMTADGQALLQYCRSVAELEGLFFSRVGAGSETDVELTLVGPTSAMASRVVEDCAGLYQKHPRLRLHLRSEDSADRVDLVRRGDADLAIVPPENVPDEMESKVLKPDRYLLVASKRWKGRRLQELLRQERVIDFEEGDSTTGRYLAEFNLGEISQGRLYVNQNAALIRLFCQGVGFGTLTESVAQPWLQRGELMTLNRGLALEDPLALTWYRRTQRPAYFSDLIRAIR